MEVDDTDEEDNTSHHINPIQKISLSVSTNILDLSRSSSRVHHKSRIVGNSSLGNRSRSSLGMMISHILLEVDLVVGCRLHELVLLASDQGL